MDLTVAAASPKGVVRTTTSVVVTTTSVALRTTARGQKNVFPPRIFIVLVLMYMVSLQ
jgi:hypothetical protein